MKTFALIKKDLKLLFFTPFGYIVLVLFTLISGAIFYALISSYIAKFLQMAMIVPDYKINVDDYIITPMFYNYAILLLILLPVIAIQFYPNEKKSGTFDMLHISKLSLGQIVMGKFIATVIFYIVMLLITFIYPLIVARNGNPDFGPIFTGYLGLLLMGMSYIALGLFISSFLKSKVSAAVMTFGVILLFWFVGWVGGSSHSIFLKTVSQSFSLLEHYYNFGKGLLDTRDLFYYISLISFVLFLNYRMLRLYPYSNSFRGFTKSFKLNESLFITLVFGILIILNVFSFRHYHVFDLTRGKRLSLSSQSLKVIEKIETPMEIMMFFKEDTPGYFEVKNLVEDFVRINSLISLKIIDPDREIEKAREYGIKIYGTTLFKYQDKIERTQVITEMGLINVIFRLILTEKFKIYIISGNGEHSIADLTKQGLSEFIKKFKNEGYGFERLNLNSVKEIPGDAACIIFSGAQKQLDDHSKKLIKNYFKKGGSIFLCIDPPPSTSFDFFLNEYGILSNKDAVIDRKNSLYGISPMMPVIINFSNHVIGGNISDGIILPITSSFSFMEFIQEKDKVDFNLYWLAKSSQDSYGETNLKAFPTQDDKDIKGPLIISIALEKYYENNEKFSKAVIIGDSDFMTNGFLKLAGNIDFIGNSLNWLTHRNTLIYIRPKEIETSIMMLNQTQVTYIFLFVVILIPIIPLLFGVLVFIFRRRWR